MYRNLMTISVFADASSKGVGSVLCVYRDGVKYTVAFTVDSYGNQNSATHNRIGSFGCSFNNKTLRTLFTGKTVFCNN